MPICYTELLYGVSFLNESIIAIEIMALSYKLKRRKIGDNYIFQETTRVSFFDFSGDTNLLFQSDTCLEHIILVAEKGNVKFFFTLLERFGNTCNPRRILGNESAKIRIINSW